MQLAPLLRIALIVLGLVEQVVTVVVLSKQLRNNS